MTRREDWPAVLASEIEKAKNIGFEWGAHDCATWAFDVRCRLTGIDGAAAWRGRYRTALGSARTLRRLGVATIDGLARRFLGEPVAAGYAQRGDIVLASESDALGICLGSRAAFLAPSGLTFRPMTEIRYGWRI